VPDDHDDGRCERDDHQHGKRPSVYDGWHTDDDHHLDDVVDDEAMRR